MVSSLKDVQHVCPICKNPLDGATSELDVLTASLKEVEDTATQFERVPAAFDSRIRAREIREWLRRGPDEWDTK